MDIGPKIFMNLIKILVQNKTLETWLKKHIRETSGSW